MYNKDEFRRLLSKGITGWEAGLLVFEDSWLASRNEGFLSPKDIDTIKAGLRSPQDITDYNRLIHLHRTADYIDSDASALISTSCYYLERVAGLGNLCIAGVLAALKLMDLPLIVTEKQLKDLKAEQKRMLLQRHHCLDEVVSRRAWTEAPESVRKEAEEPQYLQTVNQKLYEKAEKEIEKLVKAGKLNPKKLDIKAFEEPARAGERPDVAWWPENPNHTQEEAEQYLQTFISGEQLYKAGLPEWKEEIDTFKTYELDKKYWITEDPPFSVAIVQKPEKYCLDDKGYFKLDFLRKWPFRPYEEMKPDVMEMAATLAELALGCIKNLLARRQVLEELGKAIGLALDEEQNIAIKGVLEPSLYRYNNYAHSQKQIEMNLEQLQSLEPSDHTNLLLANRSGLNVPIIKLDKIKPAASELDKLRSWISQELGDEWWLKPSKSKPKRIVPESRRKHWMMMAGMPYEEPEESQQEKEQEAGQ